MESMLCPCSLFELLCFGFFEFVSAIVAASFATGAAVRRAGAFPDRFLSDRLCGCLLFLAIASQRIVLSNDNHALLIHLNCQERFINYRENHFPTSQVSRRANKLLPCRRK